MNVRRLVPLFMLFGLLGLLDTSPGWAGKGGRLPEDVLQGKVIISDKRLPTNWTSVSSYVAQLRALNKGTLWLDEKTGKVTLEFAAFFAKPLEDIQVGLVIYDITDGKPIQKTTADQFMRRGDRALFNSIVIDKEDFAMNRKYRLVIESRRRVLAAGEFLLRGKVEKYSGKVDFSDDAGKKE